MSMDRAKRAKVIAGYEKKGWKLLASGQDRVLGSKEKPLKSKDILKVLADNKKQNG